MGAGRHLCAHGEVAPLPLTVKRPPALGAVNPTDRLCWHSLFASPPSSHPSRPHHPTPRSPPRCCSAGLLAGCTVCRLRHPARPLLRWPALRLPPQQRRRRLRHPHRPRLCGRRAGLAGGRHARSALRLAVCPAPPLRVGPVCGGAARLLGHLQHPGPAGQPAQHRQLDGRHDGPHDCT